MDRLPIETKIEVLEACADVTIGCMLALSSVDSQFRAIYRNSKTIQNLRKAYQETGFFFAPASILCFEANESHPFTCKELDQKLNDSDFKSVSADTMMKAHEQHQKILAYGQYCYEWQFLDRDYFDYDTEDDWYFLERRGKPIFVNGMYGHALSKYFHHHDCEHVSRHSSFVFCGDEEPQWKMGGGGMSYAGATGSILIPLVMDLWAQLEPDLDSILEDHPNINLDPRWSKAETLVSHNGWRTVCELAGASDERRREILGKL